MRRGYSCSGERGGRTGDLERAAAGRESVIGTAHSARSFSIKFPLVSHSSAVRWHRFVTSARADGHREKTMPFPRKFATASIVSKGQTLDHVHQIVADILRRGGCPACGRIALLHVDFVSDPPAELGKLNVTSFAEGGLTAG